MLSFHVKLVQTDRRTTVKQYAPDLSIGGVGGGHKKFHKFEIYEKTMLKSTACLSKTRISSKKGLWKYCAKNMVTTDKHFLLSFYVVL